MEAERREIVQRQNGQLARHLGEPLPGELPAALNSWPPTTRRRPSGASWL
jgi:hypothetical protein